MTREELEQILEETGFKDKIVSVPWYNSSLFNINKRSFGEIMVKELCPSMQVEVGVRYLICIKIFHKNSATCSPKSRTEYMYRIKDADTFFECLREEDIREATKEELSQIYITRNEYRKKKGLSEMKKKFKLNELGQLYFEMHLGTREDFINIYGK
jgi:hypothetical protein